MFWVFCNNCFVKPAQGNKRQFYMTSCSHILCDRCTRPDATVCRRCQETCMIVQCNSEMPDEVKEVFCDVSEKIPLLVKVVDYQECHRSRLMAHYRHLAQKYNAAKVYVTEIEDKLNTVQQKYESAKLMIKELQTNIENITRKYHYYKQKCAPATPCRTPMSSQKCFTPLNALISPFAGMRPSPSRPNMLFTPKNNSAYRNDGKLSFTPDSVASSHKTASSASTTYSSRGHVPGFTPPSKTLELLSLVNSDECTDARKDFYRAVFNCEFNLSFQAPRKDTCHKCDALNLEINVVLGDEAAALKIKQELHLRKAEKARESLKSDTI